MNSHLIYASSCLYIYLIFAFIPFTKNLYIYISISKNCFTLRIESRSFSPLNENISSKTCFFLSQERRFLLLINLTFYRRTWNFEISRFLLFYMELYTHTYHSNLIFFLECTILWVLKKYELPKIRIQESRVCPSRKIGARVMFPRWPQFQFVRQMPTPTNEHRLAIRRTCTWLIVDGGQTRRNSKRNRPRFCLEDARKSTFPVLIRFKKRRSQFNRDKRGGGTVTRFLPLTGRT